MLTKGLIRGAFWVALHQRLMRRHFVIDDDQQGVQGLDERELGLWSGSRISRVDATLQSPTRRVPLDFNCGRNAVTERGIHRATERRFRGARTEVALCWQPSVSGFVNCPEAAIKTVSAGACRG